MSYSECECGSCTAARIEQEREAFRVRENKAFEILKDRLRGANLHYEVKKDSAGVDHIELYGRDFVELFGV